MRHRATLPLYGGMADCHTNHRVEFFPTRQLHAQIAEALKPGLRLQGSAGPQEAN
jgi:hypothetical protein